VDGCALSRPHINSDSSHLITPYLPTDEREREVIIIKLFGFCDVIKSQEMDASSPYRTPLTDDTSKIIPNRRKMGLLS
jgi:hypothetical protein